MVTLIRNAKIPVQGKFICKDLYIKDDVISFYEAADVDKIIEFGDSYVLPGFIDIHTHLDDYIGSCYLADTYSTASESALRNGFTTLFNFITQHPSEDIYESISKAVKKIPSDSHVKFSFHLTPVSFSGEDFKKLKKLITEGFRTFKFYTTYRNAGLYSSYGQIEIIFSGLSGTGARILVHCEDDETLSNVNTNNLNYSESYSHSLMRPPEAELKAIEKILDLAIKYSTPVHIVHVSTPAGAKMIYDAKQRYNFISCETCPQYMLLDDDYLKRKDGYKYICSPPLRSRKSADEMISLANEEYFDIYTTDHCAFTKKDKDKYKSDIRQVPNGLPGIGALVHNIYNMINGSIEDKLSHIVKHLSGIPALLTGLYPERGVIQEGSKADLVVVRKGNIHKLKSSLMDVYDPYEDFTSELEITHTISNGRIFDYS